MQRLAAFFSAPGGAVRAYLLVLLAAFNLFALLQIHAGAMKSAPDYNFAPPVSRHVDKVFVTAQERAALPFFDVNNHLLYFDRNPALYMLVIEAFLRLGAKTPVPVQCLSVLMFSAGLLLCFAWVRRAFHSVLMAVVATSFVVTTPYLLANSTHIHSDPYHFLFFNLTLYAFVRYLQASEGRARWLVWTCLSYFAVCQNYWMFYLSTYGMMLALAYQERRLNLKLMLVLGVAPMLAFVSVVVQVMVVRGGMYEGYHRLADILAARTGDWRVEDAEWYPDKDFIGNLTPRRYLWIAGDRIGRAMGLPFVMLVGMLLAALGLGGKEGLSRNRWLLFAVPAGLSWNLVMVQHTVIHRFAGQFGFFLWMLVVALFVRELHDALRPERATLGVASVVLPLAMYMTQATYLPRLQHYVHVATTEVATSTKPHKAKTKTAKSKKPARPVEPEETP
jgi:Dolichyl-phosphate-mannose-protein mannosyltransferase